MIGDPNAFGIDYMDVTRYGTGDNWVKITITGDYFSAYQAGKTDGMQPGDLFANANGWNMGSQTAPYATDTYKTGQQWDRAFKLMGADTGALSEELLIYAIDGSGSIVLSNLGSLDPTAGFIVQIRNGGISQERIRQIAQGIGKFLVTSLLLLIIVPLVIQMKASTGLWNVPMMSLKGDFLFQNPLPYCFLVLV